MRYALLLALLGVCGLVYAREEHPGFWAFAVRTTSVLASEIESLWSKDQPAPPPAPAPAPVVADPVAATKSWTSITTKYGQTIPITRVTAVDAYSVHYETTTGAGSVQISDLPTSDQQALGYDPVAARQALAAEQVRESASDATAGKVMAVEQATRQYEAGADGGGIVSDGDYASAESDMSYVSSYVVVDSASGYVRGDPYWVNRYWADRRRKELYERQRAEREQAAATSHGNQVASNTQGASNDHRTESYPQNSGDQRAPGSQSHETPTTSSSHPNSVPAPVSRPTPVPPPNHVLPQPVPNA